VSGFRFAAFSAVFTRKFSFQILQNMTSRISTSIVKGYMLIAVLQLLAVRLWFWELWQVPKDLTVSHNLILFCCIQVNSKTDGK